MIDPRGMRPTDWCNQMIQNLAPLMNAPKLFKDEDWKTWAMAVFGHPQIQGFQPPNPMFFDSWLEWAERFVQCVPWNIGVSSSSGPVEIGWTARANPTGVINFAIAYTGGGNTILVGDDGSVWRSSDGAHTWSHISNIAGFVPVQNQGPMLLSGGVLLLANGGEVRRSTDNGLTWSAGILDNINNAGGVILGADGAGNWLGVGNIAGLNTNTYAHSVDGGLTWNAAANVTAINGNALPSNLFWDGSVFCFCGLPNVGPGTVQTTTDMINWTLNNFVGAVADDAFGELQQIGGIYYAGSSLTNVLYSANSIANLTTVATQTTVSGLSAVNLLLAAGATYYVFDFNGAVVRANAPTGPYTVVPQNLTGGDTFIESAVYDSVNNSAIAIGENGGAIYTVP